MRGKSEVLLQLSSVYGDGIKVLMFNICHVSVECMLNVYAKLIRTKYQGQQRLVKMPEPWFGHDSKSDKKKVTNLESDSTLHQRKWAALE